MKIAGTLAALVALALVALFVYDAGRDDRLAPGTRVAGVEVGGLEPAEAGSRVRRHLGTGVQEPVTLAFRTHRFTLIPADAHARVDVAGLVSDALARSRDGNALGRATRDLLGNDEGIDVPARVTYSRRAVDALVRRVARRIDRGVRQADLEFHNGRLRVERARDGLEVRRAALARAIASELSSLSSDHRVAIPVRVTRRPAVRQDDLRRRYPTAITVDRSRKELRFYRRLRLVKRYKIAVGQAGYASDAGRYEIETKIVDPPWHAPNKAWAGRFAGKTVPPGSPDNPLKARFMGYHAGEGIHGTDDVASLGSRASHGCIRMSVPAVKELFKRTKVGTPLFIS